jgi:hypothetical protein
MSSAKALWEFQTDPLPKIQRLIFPFATAPPVRNELVRNLLTKAEEILPRRRKVNLLRTLLLLPIPSHPRSLGLPLGGGESAGMFRGWGGSGGGTYSVLRTRWTTTTLGVSL